MIPSKIKDDFIYAQIKRIVSVFCLTCRYSENVQLVFSSQDDVFFEESSLSHNRLGGFCPCLWTPKHHRLGKRFFFMEFTGKYQEDADLAILRS